MERGVADGKRPHVADALDADTARHEVDDIAGVIFVFREERELAGEAGTASESIDEPLRGARSSGRDGIDTPPIPPPA
jgi:hypothetical protein